MLLFACNEADRIEGEQPTIYNVLHVKRREDRIIYGLRYADGFMQTTPRGISQTLTTNLLENMEE